MPGANTHSTIGVLVGILFIAATHYFFGWFCVNLLVCGLTPFIYLAIILLYCLLPDVDHPISTITWFFIGMALTFLVYGFYIGEDPIIFFAICLLAFTFICAQWFSHRGPIHSIPAGLILSAPLYYIFGWPHAFLEFVCFYSHLASDGEWLKFW